VILAQVNRAFHRVSLYEDFASMIVVVIDVPKGTLRYAGAGNEPGYLIRRCGKTQVLNSTGMVLGLDPSASWETVEIATHLGDHLLLLTDGWAETRSPEGELFGRERVQAALEQDRNGPLAAMGSTLGRSTRQWRGAATPAADDITFLVAQWT
jgi:serine phosphatase RsbU (regulator of sigma subunit)